jgi:hypothetical protein
MLGVIPWPRITLFLGEKRGPDREYQVMWIEGRRLMGGKGKGMDGFFHPNCSAGLRFCWGWGL